jgi:hypothetical protein
VSSGNEDRSHSVHIRCVVDGEPARILLELKKRGLVRSHVDGICQGLLALWREVLKRELEEAKVLASKRLELEE